MKGSETSREAALSMLPAAGTIQRAILELFEAVGDEGLTDDEIEVELDLKHQTASAQRRALELATFVRKTNRRRLTRSGRAAGVYVVSHDLQHL